AALACFAAGGDIGYAGSERAETATGRDALAALLGKVFLRDEAYAWTCTGTATPRTSSPRQRVTCGPTPAGPARSRTGSPGWWSWPASAGGGGTARVASPRLTDGVKG